MFGVMKIYNAGNVLNAANIIFITGLMLMRLHISSPGTLIRHFNRQRLLHPPSFQDIDGMLHFPTASCLASEKADNARHTTDAGATTEHRPAGADEDTFSGTARSL